MRDVLLMLAALFLQISVAKLFGGLFFDFLTPLLLLWSISRTFGRMIAWSVIAALLVSAVYPQPFLVIAVGFVLAQWLWRVTFFENWRSRPRLVFLAGVAFSFIWQGCGLIFALFTADLIATPLCFPPFLSSIVSAGLFTVLVFRVASFSAELEGKTW